MNEADRKLLTKKMDAPFECERVFITPNDFFAVWEWAKEQEWWIDFIRTKTLIDPNPKVQIMEEDEMCKRVGLNDLIDPYHFPELIVQFGKEVLGWKN